MPADVTQRFAATFVDELVAGGLREVCISPGSRSAPLAMAFVRHPGVEVVIQVDERSCSFFALGLAKALDRPVAILCTSGTAAVQFHAAVVEAHHSRTPLLVLTADRPPELREVGAGQTIDQVRLYGTATRWSFDAGPPELGPNAGRTWRALAARSLAECAGPPAGPVHLNLPFREPLVGVVGEAVEAEPPLSRPAAVLKPRRDLPSEDIAGLRSRLEAAQRPLLVAGEMREGDVLAGLLPALAATGIPVLAEPTSQLRLAAGPSVVATYDALLRDQRFAEQMRPDLVIRVGSTPTSKVLNQFLARAGAEMILVDPDRAWADPDRLATTVVQADAAQLLPALVEGSARAADGWVSSWTRAGGLAADALAKAIAELPLFEGHAVGALSAALPDGADLVVGSSMPIRDVDTFWPAAGARRVLANRGANGLDGFVSTGLGVAAAAARTHRLPTAVLCGDLTLFHDMNGLWSVRRHGLKPLVLVVDNNGGGIFSFLPQAAHTDVFEEVFGTPLDLDLEVAGRMYGLSVSVIEDAPDLEAATRQGLGTEPRMVIARFSREASVTSHRACWAAVSEALAAGL